MRSSHGLNGAPARKRQSARYALTKPSCAASSASARVAGDEPGGAEGDALVFAHEFLVGCGVSPLRAGDELRFVQVVGPPLRLIHRLAAVPSRLGVPRRSAWRALRVLEPPDRADLLEAEPAEDRVRGVGHRVRHERRRPAIDGVVPARADERPVDAAAARPLRRGRRRSGRRRGPTGRRAPFRPAGRRPREEADGDPEPLRLLEVLAEPRPILRAAVLRRVERVPLKLVCGSELLEGLDARDVDSVRRGGSCVSTRAWTIGARSRGSREAERLQRSWRSGGSRRRADPPDRLLLRRTRLPNLGEKRLDLVRAHVDAADRGPRRPLEDADALVREALDARSGRDVREAIRRLGVLAQLRRDGQFSDARRARARSASATCSWRARPSARSRSAPCSWRSAGPCRGRTSQSVVSISSWYVFA